MPKSRARKKAVYTPPQRSKAKEPSPAWLVPSMLALWFIGVAWIVVYYVAGDRVPGMEDLGRLNLLVGFGLVVVGFIMSTRWR